jgi:hypothetical protein
MKTNKFSIKKQSGKVVLANLKVVGNATIPVSATPFPLRDTTYYQIGAHGDYQQEAN